MNDESLTTVEKHSIGDPHDGAEGIYRELTVGQDLQAPVLRRLMMMSWELGERFESTPIGELVVAVFAICGAILSAGCALVDESRSWEREVLVVDFPEPGLVKR